MVDKEVLIANLNARVDAAVAEKGTIEESVAILKHSNRTLEEKVTASINEIVKGNQIIERLSSDVRSAKSKLKSKSEASHSMQKELQVTDCCAQCLQRSSLPCETLTNSCFCTPLGLAAGEATQRRPAAA